MDSAQVDAVTIAEMAKFTGMVMEMGSRRKSNPKGLAQAFNDFATTPAQAESFEETFKAARPSSESYHDARLCLQMCKLCKFESVGIDSVLRGVKSEIRSMRGREPESYGSTMVYFAYCGMSFCAWWKRIFLQSFNTVNSEFASNLDRLKQLRAAGYDISQVQAMLKTLQNDYDIKSTMLLKKAEDSQKLYIELMKALAENLENPDAVDSQTLDAFQWYADAYSGSEDDLAVRRLGDDVRKILKRNRSKARRLAAAEERKKKAAEEKRRAEAQKKAVEAWWEQHPDRKSELETKVKEVRAAIKELDREEAKWKNVKYEIDDQLKKPTSAENKLRYRKGKRTSAAKKLEAIRAVTIEATPSEKMLSYTESAIANKKSAKALLSDSDGSTITGDQSIVNSDARLKELSDLETELANLGILSWGKKRRLTEQIAQRKGEILSELEREIASLEDKVLELEAKAREERAAEEAKLAKEEHEAEIAFEEASSAVKEAELAAEESRKSLQEELEPRYSEAMKAISEIGEKKTHEQNSLKAAESELKSPRMSKEFISKYMAD